MYNVQNVIIKEQMIYLITIVSNVKILYAILYLLTISKEYLFNLALNKKSEYDIIKASYDNLDKNIKILKLIYDYMKLNFDIVNLMIKRENIFEENKKFTKIKDNSLINVKILEKKIK